jgi:hypothetical protein
MQQGYSLPRHIEIADNPEQHLRQRDHLIAELTREVGYPVRKPTADTPGYAKVSA